MEVFRSYGDCIFPATNNRSNSILFAKSFAINNILQVSRYKFRKWIIKRFFYGKRKVLLRWSSNSFGNFKRNRIYGDSGLTRLIQFPRSRNKFPMKWTGNFFYTHRVYFCFNLLVGEKYYIPICTCIYIYLPLPQFFIRKRVIEPTRWTTIAQPKSI